MKAKVIETGETIDITIFLDRFGGPKRYWDSKNKKEYSKSDLDFRVGVQMNDETVKPIDWEQRRYEIAKDMLVASYSQIEEYDVDVTIFADISCSMGGHAYRETKKGK